MKNQYRFFVDRDLDVNCEFVTDSTLSHQLGKVLRLASGDEISVFGRNGREFLSNISFDGNKVAIKCVKEIISDWTLDISLTIALCMPKKDKPELVLQKCTEIGVSNFIFLNSDNSVSKTDKTAFDKKYPRWQKITTESVEQSGQISIPHISFLQNIDSLGKDYDHCYFAHAKQNSLLPGAINHNLLSGKSIIVVIGPEGGFSQREIDMLEAKGYIPLSLGRSVLRCETAAIAAGAIILIK